MAASANFALKAGAWFRRGRLLIVSPDSQATACPLSGRNSTYRPVQISGTTSEFTKKLADDWVKMGGQVHTLPPEDLAKMKTLLSGVADDVTKDQPAVHDMLVQVRAIAAKH